MYITHTLVLIFIIHYYIYKHIIHIRYIYTLLNIHIFSILYMIYIYMTKKEGKCVSSISGHKRAKDIFIPLFSCIIKKSQVYI